MAAALWVAGWAWPGLGAWAAQQLVLDTGNWSARPWTLWSANLVHLSPLHLAGNLLALGALAWLGRAWHLAHAAGIALALAWPLSGLLLSLIWPGVGSYRGLSMLNHAIVLLCWAFGVINGVAKPWTFVLLAGVGLKLLDERAWSRPVAFDAEWGFAVVYAAHLAGAAAGLVCGLPAALLQRWLRQRPATRA